MKLSTFFHSLTVVFFVIFISSVTISAQTTAFNYQGKLSVTGTPQPSYQMQFKLFGSVGGTDQIGNTITEFDVPVNDGVFNVKLDFGADVFTGADRFLEISVRPNANVSFLTLNPRQQIASSPYSIRTLSAAKADIALDANKLGGVAASEYVTNSTVGSSFIRNAAAPQQTANFNINGSGLIGGSLGIGAAANTRFTLGGGVPWTSSGWTASMNMQNVTAFGWEANASGQRFGIGQTGGGLYFFRTNSAFGNTASAANYDLMISDTGSIGMGTIAPSPFYRLDVSGHGGVRSVSNSASHFVAETTGGTNSWARVYMRSSNRSWFMGTSQNFNGDQFYLTDETSNQLRMAIQPNGGTIMFPLGNVGIGTVQPPTKLFVSDGNVGQSASNFGLAKAMLLVRNNGVGGNATIEKCYNAVSGSISGNCGFGVNQVGGAGIITISFPFRVTDRFISITPIYNSTLPSYAHVVSFDTNDISGGTVRVVSQGYENNEADFYIIVF